MSSMVEEILPIGKELNVAYTKRVVGEGTTPYIVFIHGFGSSKEFFRFAFEDPSLNDYSLISLDLIGFGKSTKHERFSYEMSNQASIVLQVLNQLEVKSFHLCAHSMGGLVAMEIINQSPPQTLSFINLEGNLTLDDCFVTAKILDYPYDTFLTSGRREFEQNLTDYPSYLNEFQKASSNALYKSAEDTVKLSSNSRILEDFLDLSIKKIFIYGEKNKDKFPVEQTLITKGVPVFYIPNSDHEMAEQNPSHLYSIIRRFLGNR
ncbi:MAG: alpha/beta fold hydrolase [Candidatus Hodarchaeales archaeon]|jgi:pimeloyl-ACP methyl ester carboxylesterase